METAPLKSFATWARTTLIGEVTARIAVVLAPGSSARVERSNVVTALEKAIASAGGGELGRAAVADRVAYTWFNRIIALRFMDANGYTGIGVVSPERGRDNGQPEILAEAKRGNIDSDVISNQYIVETVTSLLNGTRRSEDPQGEAFSLLLANYCRFWNRSMPFMFERESNFTELLMPSNLLADDSVISHAVTVLTEKVCRDVEVIGWLYQFYISERKDEVFAGFKNNKKASAAEIPAATQLFTPHWIVRYLVENSLGCLWLLNRPMSRLGDQMEYYIAPVDDKTDFLKVSGPEELKIIDPACGSGHILTYAFDLLYAIYEEDGYAPSDIPGLILANNLYGTEIDPRAGALAAFALTMKARARQRTFFKNQVAPNICVLEPLSFTPGELDILVTHDGDLLVEEAFWNQFQNADTFGSLIRPHQHLAELIGRHLERNALEDEDFLQRDLVERADRVIKQAEYLRQRYNVVVANPPYMGNKNMGPLLSERAQSNFPESKSDLFAMFIERSLELILPHGISAMVTMQSWMFLSRYEDFRKKILSDSSIVSMAHLGARAFETISGEIVQVTATCIAGRSPRGIGSYLRLVDLDTSAKKDSALRGIAANNDNPRLFNIDQSMFRDIPGTPIAYWSSPELRNTFQTGRKIEDAAPVRQGFQTGDNDRFMRFWFEVSRKKINYNATSTSDFHNSKSKFAPYLKGGSFRKWYGNDEYVVAFDHDDYEALAKLGNKLPSRTLYFRESITWSALSSTDFGARYAGIGSTFSAKGACAFPTSEFSRTIVLAVLNSSISRDLLEFMGATLDFNVGSLRQIPLPQNISEDEHQQIRDLVTELIEIHKEDWVSDEYAPGFQVNELLKHASEDSMTAAAQSVVLHWAGRTERVSKLQTVLDSLIGAAYGLPGADNLPVTLQNFMISTSTQLESRNFVNNMVVDLVSYAVGCMFGRYSLDEPGLILADKGGTIQDYLAKVPNSSFGPDTDNVIPIVDGDWFEDDIVTLFRQFLRAAFGEQHFEENLRFVTESLGVKDLRDYFVKSFYKDHVQRYKKRPIYWLFSSPKGSFNALIYMHRYTSSTVSTVLNEYLREFKAKLAASRQHHERLAAGTGTAREKAAAQKEVDRLRKVLLELDEYEHDVLYPLATQQIQIDLDDGVKANYPKFGTALKKIVGLEAKDD